MLETVFAADLGESRVSAAVLDREGKILARDSEPLDRSSALAPLKQIARLATDLSNGRRFRYKAAGIAASGIVHSDGTVVSPALAASGKAVAVRRLIKDKLRVPVVVESGRNAAALGETCHGAGRGKSDLIVLSVGAGITAGIIADGRLLRGSEDLSGSAGWMVVSEADGFEVRKYGGLEAFASAAGIVRAAKNAMDAGFGGELAEYDPEAFTAEDIAELARRGNLACRQIYRRVGKLLGLATANLISLFNPQVVVFGGELAAAADLFWDELTQTAVARCLPLSGRRIRIRLSGLGADANLYGAAYLAWQAADQRTNVPGVAHTPAVLIGKARGKRPSSTK